MFSPKMIHSYGREVAIGVSLVILGLMALGYPKRMTVGEKDILSGCFTSRNIKLRLDKQSMTMTIDDGSKNQISKMSFDKTKAWYSISLEPDISIDKGSGRFFVERGKEFSPRRIIYDDASSNTFTFVDLFKDDVEFRRTACDAHVILSG